MQDLLIWEKLEGERDNVYGATERFHRENYDETFE